MKSIKTKMITFFGLIVVIVCIGIGVSSYIMANDALESNLETILPEVAKQTANNIYSEVEGEIKTLETVAQRSELKDSSLSIQEKLNILAAEGVRLDAVRMGIADTNGNLVNTDGSTADISQRPYFQSAAGGETAVTDPLVTADGLVVVGYAAPILDNGTVIGVIVETRDGNALSEITNSIKVGNNGTAFMINSAGVSIANPDQQKVLDSYSTTETAKEDKSLEALADIEQKMINGETGMGRMEYEGIQKFLAYAPITQTGWSVAITMTKAEALSALSGLKTTVIIVSAVFIIISLLLVYMITHTLTKGIKSSSRHLKLLAGGDFSQEVSSKYLNQKDEIGEMMHSMKAMQESTGKMIKNIRENSNDINKQAENLSTVTEEIADSSQSVTETITEVAKGTNDQSENLVSITNILEQFNRKLTDIINAIQDVSSNSKDISIMATDSSKETNLLNQSIANVSSSFKEFNQKAVSLGEEIHQIGEITNLINSIADQTNLLALNASIEAARAGEAGKGFAVVANEIGHLAEQAKVSSDNINKVVTEISASTDSMVQNSITVDQELINQVGVIEKSLSSFQRIINAIDGVIPKIEQIQVSALDIEEDKNKVMSQVEGISSAAMEISASSEEISASSEQMSASSQEVAAAAEVLTQATNQMLDEVKTFKVD